MPATIQTKPIMLDVKRFPQRPAECGIATVSSLANFFNSSVEYENVRTMLPVRHRSNGLYTSEQAYLLNRLGFNKISIVTADLTLVDFSWAKLPKSILIKKLKKLATFYKRKREYDSCAYVSNMIKWLSDPDYDNNLIIDYNFKNHICKHLKRGTPIGASVNWTSLFKFKKGNGYHNDDIRGEAEEHAFVLRGFNKKYVFVVDSHYQCYLGTRAKFRSGYYKIPWEKFLVNIPSGDLIIIHKKHAMVKKNITTEY